MFFYNFVVMVCRVQPCSMINHKHRLIWWTSNIIIFNLNIICFLKLYIFTVQSTCWKAPSLATKGPISYFERKAVGRPYNIFFFEIIRSKIHVREYLKLRIISTLDYVSNDVLWNFPFPFFKRNSKIFSLCTSKLQSRKIERKPIRK